MQETQAKRSWKRAHLQDGAHAWRARRPLSTAANNHSSPWNKRRAQQVRVGDRTGAFISSGTENEALRDRKAPPYRLVAAITAELLECFAFIKA